ncbi:MAG: hypothetical protein LVS60_05420 [Nodosilinea sp. LVE1205-7]
MTPEAQSAAIAYFLDAPASTQEGTDSTAIRPEVLPDGFWQSTALAPVESRELALPEGFDAAAMIRHFDGVMGQATDTQSLVAIAKLAITAADTAMDQKLSAQRQALNQAEQHQAQLAAMVAEAKQDMKVKALEARILAERQTSQTRQAEQVFAELMALGKPTIQEEQQ